MAKVPPGERREILVPLLLWSAVGIVVGIGAEVIFAQMSSGVWLWEWRMNLDSSHWYDVTRSAIATVGLFGLGGAALLAYRRQHTAERGQLTSEQQHSLEKAKQAAADMTDLRARYAAAAAQLGHEKPWRSPRLAGDYAMAALADDWQKAG